MVTLNKIYTRTGDGGKTRLATGELVDKTDLRVATYGAVDETNSVLGIVRLHTGDDAVLDAALARIQNELFDLGSDLATPLEADAPWAVRTSEAQVTRLETEIDAMNADLPTLPSFILPGKKPAGAYLHLARTICRRAEREAVALAAQAEINPFSLKYLNRLSDWLFVASRHANGLEGDVLWVPGASR
jgi:cob(I)alamin adenosyltransferase